MIPITRALAAEHEMFRSVFTQVEQALPAVRTLGEVKQLTRLVEGLLLGHAAIEDDLLLLARPAVDGDGRRLDVCVKQHHEIDHRLTRVYTAKDVEQARVLFRAALDASRRHFKHEERVVFPLIEQAANLDTLTRLGTRWFLRQRTPAHWKV
jgi:hemerythrin-like domain-containing protein